MACKKIFTANSLKLIAVFAMTLDHFAWVAFSGYSESPVAIALHIIGRLTCPIMSFFIAEGFFHTRDVNKYTLRLLALAIISHFAFVFSSGAPKSPGAFIPFYYGNILEQTSVVWALFLGLVLLRLYFSSKIKSLTLKVILIAIICALSLPADWVFFPPLAVLMFGINRGDCKKQMLGLAFAGISFSAFYILNFDFLYGIIQLAAVLAIPLLMCYNGKRGNNESLNKIMKWFFYICYPSQLFIMGLI